MMILSPITLNITETSQDLQLLLSQQSQPYLRDKIVALYLLKLGKVKSFSDLAKTIGYDTNIIKHWLQIYSTQGLQGFLRVNP
ncbi:hypothetical protein IQ249_03130 [Lusitaniella coriacea LEGE 07157]|uniref:Uncharacterized protein n=1 Tax=Lusitaniella coriacea LEGE 07157 TaxID=945747 RepID=A0A8J7B8N5_9CYAN|nr:hypothetical protein [Lusitaniella coriacea]MBE9114883.1 hypothetical protein [Lusitaniella coriacea LEGE 07157]